MCIRDGNRPEPELVVCGRVFVTLIQRSILRGCMVRQGSNWFNGTADLSQVCFAPIVRGKQIVSVVAGGRVERIVMGRVAETDRLRTLSSSNVVVKVIQRQ